MVDPKRTKTKLPKRIKYLFTNCAGVMYKFRNHLWGGFSKRLQKIILQEGGAGVAKDDVIVFWIKNCYIKTARAAGAEKLEEK